MLSTAQPKPRPRLLDTRDRAAQTARIDREERAKCHVRSGGRCEVRTLYGTGGVRIIERCERRASENHHLIGGSGRRNKGRSIVAAHRLDVCQRCHQDITGKVLRPIDGTKKEDAATVRYERIT